jgi:hypothetical protein
VGEKRRWAKEGWVQVKTILEKSSGETGKRDGAVEEEKSR